MNPIKIINWGFCIVGILKASSQYLWMITLDLGGGIFVFAYFQNGGKCVKSKQKVVYLSKYRFDFDDVDIKLYVIVCDEAMFEVIG